jgi:hypothetical protein
MHTADINRGEVIFPHLMLFVLDEYKMRGAIAALMF